MSGSPYGTFGIDLGTTYSAVGYIDEMGRAAVTRNSHGFDTTPSVVYFESKTDVIVGKTAMEAAGLYPDQVVSLIKREMGDRKYRRTFFGVEYTPPSISALILAALAREAEQDTGRRVTDAVITVPAYFGPLEKDATRKAGEIAGLNVVGTVPEPVAAAFHYGVTGSVAGATVLVYDLGGATFDLSLIKTADNSPEILAIGGDRRLGGADWDEKLLDYLVEQTVSQCGDDSLRDDEPMLQDLRIRAEETKKALSTAEIKTLIVRYTGNPAKITVTRAQFEQMTADLLDETIRITRRTLAQAEEKYPGISQQISEVLLVGGSSRMPAVSEALSNEFGWDPRLSDPDLAVAKGAALYAIRQGYRMRFDEVRYVQDFLKKLRGARTLPDDLLERYAITLPATDQEISVQLKTVRAFWNKVSSGSTYAGQAAKMCRAEDERLRAQHGSGMEKRAWWEARQAERRSAAQESVTSLAEELRRTYGDLGVVTASTLHLFAGKLGLTQADALQAVGRAGLALVDGISLPDSPPLPSASFEALLKAMSECAVSSVPELVHPGAGSFSLIERYACAGAPGRRLDAVAVEAQSAEADKRAVSATENARRTALKILGRAAKDGADLREIALYHLVKVAQEYVPPSMRMATAALQEAGLERRDAAVIAVLLGDQSTARGAAGLGKVRSEEAIRETDAARQRLDAPVSRPGQGFNGRQARLFISYSHRDERYLKRLETHLANLRREGVITEWHDQMITSGEEWRSRIRDSLESADCVLLLVTPDFIASDYCYSVEMTRALERHREGRIRIFPVIVRPTDWRHTPLRELQVLPKDGKPIVEWASRDRAWLDVTDRLRQALMGIYRGLLEVSLMSRRGIYASMPGRFVHIRFARYSSRQIRAPVDFG